MEVMNCRKWNSTEESVEGGQVRAVQKQNKKSLPKKKKIQRLLLLKHIYAPVLIDNIANIHMPQPNGSTHHLVYVEFNCLYSIATKQAKQNEYLKENILYNIDLLNLRRNVVDLVYPWDLPREQRKPFLTAVCKLWNKQVLILL